jgi:hypothetical protein
VEIDCQDRLRVVPVDLNRPTLHYLLLLWILRFLLAFLIGKRKRLAKHTLFFFFFRDLNKGRRERERERESSFAALLSFGGICAVYMCGFSAFVTLGTDFSIYIYFN